MRKELLLCSIISIINGESLYASSLEIECQNSLSEDTALKKELAPKMKSEEFTEKLFEITKALDHLREDESFTDEEVQKVLQLVFNLQEKIKKTTLPSKRKFYRDVSLNVLKNGHFVDEEGQSIKTTFLDQLEASGFINKGDIIARDSDFCLGKER